MTQARAPKLTATVGGMEITKAPGHGVMVEGVYWEHYAQRVEAIDMPSLDEGSFLAGCAGAFISLAVSLVGVIFGTDHASPYFIAVLAALLACSALGTLFFWRQYRQAKTTMKKTGAQICKEMREVADDQRRRAGLDA